MCFLFYPYQNSSILCSHHFCFRSLSHSYLPAALLACTLLPFLYVSFYSTVPLVVYCSSVAHIWSFQVLHCAGHILYYVLVYPTLLICAAVAHHHHYLVDHVFNIVKYLLFLFLELLLFMSTLIYRLLE